MQEVLETWYARVDAGKLTADTRIIYQIAGGFPRLEEEYRLSGDGTAWLLREDLLHSIKRREHATRISGKETLELFQLIRSALPDLLLQVQPRALVPDSIPGSLTVEVDGDKQVCSFVWQNVIHQAWYKPLGEAVERLRARL